MKGDKIFILTINEVSEFEQFDHDPVPYENREEARAHLKSAKESAIREYIDEEDPGICIVQDTPDYFSLCSQNEGWGYTHYEVTITECTIL